MGDQLALFMQFYYRPSRAASDALDKGSFAFAVCLALVSLGVWRMAPTLLLPIVTPTLFSLMTMFLVMMPLAVAIVAAWDGLGSASVVLRREYVSLAVAGLFAWSAAYLVFGLLNAVAPIVFAPVVAHFAFLVLFVICLRTALGTSVGHAVVAAIGGWLLVLGVEIAWPVIGRLGYFLFSPWILFILYRYYSPDVRGLGDAMASRRSFRRNLEASMVNPRDADAHYQLGLIYEHRRQYEQAEASFRRAVEIQPEEAESQLHLARALRVQGRSAEALPHIEAALKADPNVSSREAWRDYGAILLDVGRAPDACVALEHYTQHREYDPEGLYYNGLALKAAGRVADARDAFQRAVTAVDTAPKYRRGQLRLWASRARAESKNL
jgi:Tfp pilus assembly protein PilF